MRIRKPVNYEVLLNRDALTNEYVNNMCMSLNYFMCRYNWTRSAKRKEKFFTHIFYHYYRMHNWMVHHPEHPLDWDQEHIFKRAKAIVRSHFNEED